MNTWQAIGAFVAASVLLVLALLFMDERHLAAEEKSRILLVVAQTASAIQEDVTAVRLQQLQWELNDIVARASAGKALAGDASRKIVLEERIKALVSK